MTEQNRTTGFPARRSVLTLVDRRPWKAIVRIVVARLRTVIRELWHAEHPVAKTNDLSRSGWQRIRTPFSISRSTSNCLLPNDNAAPLYLDAFCEFDAVFAKEFLAPGVPATGQIERNFWLNRPVDQIYAHARTRGRENRPEQPSTVCSRGLKLDSKSCKPRSDVRSACLRTSCEFRRSGRMS